MSAAENADLKRTPVLEDQGLARDPSGRNAGENADQGGGGGREGQGGEAHGPSPAETRPPAENPGHGNPARMAGAGTSCPTSKFDANKSMLDMDLTPTEKAKYVGQLMVNLLGVTGEEYMRRALKGADAEQLKDMAETIAKLTDVVQCMQLLPHMLDALKSTGDPSTLTKGKTGALVAKLAGKAQGIKKLRKGDGRTTPEKLKDQILGPQD